MRTGIHVFSLDLLLNREFWFLGRQQARDLFNNILLIAIIKTVIPQSILAGQRAFHYENILIWDVLKMVGSIYDILIKIWL